jgi:hypothetical protein
MPLIPDIPPVAAAAIDPEWVEVRRDILRRFGFPVRAAAGARIEIRSLTPPEHLSAHDRLKMNPWCFLHLPDGAPSFATDADRDEILQRLTAR